MTLPFAEDCNYFGTSQSSPDVWMERTCRLIDELGGKVEAEGFGREPLTGRAAYMLAFQIGQDRFRIVWPILPVQNPKNERAAKIQAATFIYHDCKAKAVKIAIFGARTTFFEYLMLDNVSVSEMSSDTLLESMPELFMRPPALSSGEVEGEFKEI